MKKYFILLMGHEYIKTCSRKNRHKRPLLCWLSFRIKDQRTLNFCFAVLFNCLGLFSVSLFDFITSFHIAFCLARMVLITLLYCEDLKAAFPETLKEKILSPFHTALLITNQEQIISNTLREI